MPPSALVAIRKEGVELTFEIVDEGLPVFKEGGSGEPMDIPDTSVQTDVGIGIPMPVLRVGDMRLRRILPHESAIFEKVLATGGRFLCLWNMSFGPALEAVLPNDPPVQKEISVWFESRGAEIVFAHYGPSIRVGTRSRGLVPLVLFQILEEEEEENAAVEQSDTN